MQYPYKYSNLKVKVRIRGLNLAPSGPSVAQSTVLQVLLGGTTTDTGTTKSEVDLLQ